MSERLRPCAPALRGAGLAIGVVLVLAGCAERHEVVPLPDAAPRARGPHLPQALMVRFEEVKGTGFSREGWELEVLQMGSDVRVRGSIRTGGVAVPILTAMTPDEYAAFWEWLRAFPLDGARPQEDPAAPAGDWRKTLQVDVVLDEETRWKSRTRWTRPLADASWVTRLEQRLHQLALDLAQREVERRERDAADPAAGADPGGGPGDRSDPGGTNGP